MVMKTLGFDCLKNHRGMILVMSEQKYHNGSKFMFGFEVFGLTKNVCLTVPIHIHDITLT